MSAEGGVKSGRRELSRCWKCRAAFSLETQTRLSLIAQSPCASVVGGSDAHEERARARESERERESDREHERYREGEQERKREGHGRGLSRNHLAASDTASQPPPRTELGAAAAYKTRTRKHETPNHARQPLPRALAAPRPVPCTSCCSLRPVPCTSCCPLRLVPCTSCCCRPSALGSLVPPPPPLRFLCNAMSWCTHAHASARAPRPLAPCVCART